MTHSKNDFIAESRILADIKTNSDDASVSGFARIYRALRSRRFLITLTLLFAVLAIGICIRYLPDLAWVAEREDWLRSKIGSAPIA